MGYNMQHRSALAAAGSTHKVEKRNHHHTAGSVGSTQRGWGPECQPNSTRRRRCWMRRRRRQPRAVISNHKVAQQSGGGLVGGSGAVQVPLEVAAGAGAGASADGAGVGVTGAGDDGCCEQGMVLVVVALCSLLRGCQLLESKVRFALLACFMLGVGGSILVCFAASYSPYSHPPNTSSTHTLQPHPTHPNTTHPQPHPTHPPVTTTHHPSAPASPSSMRRRCSATTTRGCRGPSPFC